MTEEEAHGTPPDSRTLLCIVETPAGSRNKYEFDHELGRMRLDRFLASSVVFPVDYGFVPDTSSRDGDPLDVLLCTSEPTFPGCAVTARVVGALCTEDEQGGDEKVVCVPCGDPAWEEVHELADLPQQLRAEIEQFFATYKDLDRDRHSRTCGWRECREAWALVREARERFVEQSAAG